MKLTLSENIRAQRRQRGLTQEQLSEVLGVTTGAVHKWESGLSVPELDMIVEMADFFDMSVDALLGYRVRDNGIGPILRRLNEYCRVRDPEALTEAEKALKKYPHSFEIVHNCADIYSIFAMGSHDASLFRRTLELLEQARLLLPQNTDPGISEHTIYGEMAEAYMMLGERDRALKLLMDHNVGGIFSAGIGTSLAIYMGRPAEAEPWLSEALLSSLSDLINTIAGYVFLYRSRGEHAQARDIALLGTQLLRGMMRDGPSAFPGKMYSIMLVLLAGTQARTGKRDGALSSLREARSIAAGFDASPDYGIETLRFAGTAENARFRDSLGESAMEGILNMLDLLNDAELKMLWKETDENEEHE